jgi:hypothetical protein
MMKILLVIGVLLFPAASVFADRYYDERLWTGLNGNTFRGTFHAVSADGTNVEFFEGPTSLGSFPLDATGRARLAISTLGVGTHGITAVYPGTVNYLTSTSPVFNQTIVKANSRTVVTTSGSPANFGSTVTFTATVSAVAPGAGVPTGTVQFRIDGVNVGVPTNLVGGQAQYTTNTLAVGLHTASTGLASAAARDVK